MRKREARRDGGRMEIERTKAHVPLPHQAVTQE